VPLPASDRNTEHSAKGAAPTSHKRNRAWVFNAGGTFVLTKKINFSGPHKKNKKLKSSTLLKKNGKKKKKKML
jgi:hypothetical protein